MAVNVRVAIINYGRSGGTDVLMMLPGGWRTFNHYKDVPTAKSEVIKLLSAQKLQPLFLKPNQRL